MRRKLETGDHPGPRAARVRPARAATGAVRDDPPYLPVMSNYTKTNLKDLDNSAESFGLGDNLETRFARKAMGLEQFGFSYQRMQPNFRQPFGHVHREQEEVYLIIGGGGRIKVEDEIVELKQWDAIRVPGGNTRALESGPEGMELIAMGGNPTGDADMAQNWWTD
jgi:mannose-6-phosphate isomerase-like protein (cupin superfamily)